MKKILPVLLVVIVAVGIWFAISSRIETETSPAATTVATQTSSQVSQQGQAGSGAVQEDTEEAAEADVAVDERPAAERYKTAEEALKAIKDAAADYDDLVLDQFTEPGDNCTWCNSFYASVKELLFSPDTKADQKSYYAEVLAISGKLDNVKTLVDAVVNAKNQEEADVFAEALELTVGKDDVVKYLGEQLNQPNETLKEAAVAAITNQGSKLAVETLYSNTVEKGDPDGYYSLGIGLGEVVPDEEALPYLQELAMKRDAYSHLAIKSLLNSGLDGLKIVMDVLSNSKNPDADKEMLNGAKEHVSYDEDNVAYLKQVAESGKNNPAVTLAKEILADFEQAESESDFLPTPGGPGDTEPVTAPMSLITPAGK